MKVFCSFLLCCFFLPVAIAAGPVVVTAKQVDGAPGAIVCSNLATVATVLDLYARNRQAATEPAPQGQSTLTNGDALEQPPLDQKGCVVAKAGTPMTLNGVKNGAATVSFKLPSGKSFSGVTMPKMYTADSHESH